ncbi:hypothetical protein NHJ13051_004772 [Beauveria bassiana]
MISGKPVESPSSINLDNLDRLNTAGEKKVALTSKDDVAKFPPWLYGQEPDGDGKLHNATASVVIVVEKNAQDVDAFYFYFYSFDQGGNMTQVKEPLGSFIGSQDGLHFGSHVGDWEHNMVRFRGGRPTGIYYSQHSDGAAYDWHDERVMLKDGRPYVYSALGSHANYPASGEQTHDSVLFDYCDSGMLWDPVLSAYLFHLDPDSFRLTRLSPSKSNLATSNLTSFFYFDGIWGDHEYAQDDPRQHKVPWVGLKRFVAGPQGPAYKGLVRKGLFPDGHGGKNLLQWAAAAFRALYPNYFRAWRKWITMSVIVVLVTVLVVGGGLLARRCKQNNKPRYEQLPVENIPLMEISCEHDGPCSALEDDGS